ncbi:transcriptional regulator [Enterobacter sp. KBR-315C3_2022]|uniref:winged helix-turn-helix domain-containing protein n=1 Tax=Enterobacter sp. KBR-315C3_2022 TaxID=3242494 RepID=UPI0035299A98
MDKTFLIDGRLVFHSGQNALANLLHPDLSEVLNEPCARCLEALLAAQGNIVSQEELYKAGWGEGSKDVSPNTLYQNILLARKAFRKVAESSDDFIITVPRQGFRFNEALSVTIADGHNNPVFSPDERRDQFHRFDGDNTMIRRTAPSLAVRLLMPASLLLIVLSVVVFFIAYSKYGLSRQDDFTGDYVFSGKHNGCEIYTNKQQQLTGGETERLLKKWSYVTADCGSLPLIYISSYRNHLSIFLLSCDNKNKADRVCKTGYLRLSE